MTESGSGMRRSDAFSYVSVTETTVSEPAISVALPSPARLTTSRFQPIKLLQQPPRAEFETNMMLRYVPNQVLREKERDKRTSKSQKLDTHIQEISPTHLSIHIIQNDLTLSIVVDYKPTLSVDSAPLSK